MSESNAKPIMLQMTPLPVEIINLILGYWLPNIYLFFDNTISFHCLEYPYHNNQNQNRNHYFVLYDNDYEVILSYCVRDELRAIKFDKQDKKFEHYFYLRPRPIAVAASNSRKIYSIRNEMDTITYTVPITDSNIMLCNMITAKNNREYVSSLIYKNQILVFGGRLDGNHSLLVESYDILQKKWNRLADMSSFHVSSRALLMTDMCIALIGYNTIDLYDPENDKWEEAKWSTPEIYSVFDRFHFLCDYRLVMITRQNIWIKSFFNETIQKFDSQHQSEWFKNK